ncbi:MAG: hypothetical protein AAF357_11100, partial [Verrucomicrobiota bacterium]
FEAPKKGKKEVLLPLSLLHSSPYKPNSDATIRDLGTLYAKLAASEKGQDGDPVLALLLNDFEEFGFNASLSGAQTNLMELSAELFESSNEVGEDAPPEQLGLLWGAIVSEAYRISQNPRESGFRLGISPKSQFLIRISRAISF